MAGRGVNTRSFAPAGLTKERQVSDMDAYQIIMICIASVTLVLKLIKLYHNIGHK